MSRGLGRTQRFILDELSQLREGEWLEVGELATRYAHGPYTDSLLRSVRNSCRRMLFEIPPILERKTENNKRLVRLTDHGYTKVTNPWELRRLEMVDVWNRVLADQQWEEDRKAGRRKRRRRS